MFQRLLGHYQVASGIYKGNCTKITTLDNRHNKHLCTPKYKNKKILEV